MQVLLLAWAVVITVLVGITRVYLGVHWPTDVLAGWTLGACWAIACWLMAVWLQRRGTLDRAPAGPPGRSPGEAPRQSESVGTA